MTNQNIQWSGQGQYLLWNLNSDQSEHSNNRSRCYDHSYSGPRLAKYYRGAMVYCDCSITLIVNDEFSKEDVDRDLYLEYSEGSPFAFCRC